MPDALPPLVVSPALASVLIDREVARPGMPHLLPRAMRAEAALLARRGLLRAASADGFWRLTPAGADALGLAD